MKCDKLTFIKEFVEISGAVLKVDENDNGVTFTTTCMPLDTALPKFNPIAIDPLFLSRGGWFSTNTFNLNISLVFHKYG